MTPAQSLGFRKDPKRWFQGFGRYRDEETRLPKRGKANVLQRRGFEHYRRCQNLCREHRREDCECGRDKRGVPCRMFWLKYRRAGSSTGGECLMYMHAMNYNARLGVIGTDYKASVNMVEMFKFYGQHDDFPGWSAKMGAIKEQRMSWEQFYHNENLESVPFEDRTEKAIATKIEFSHGSSVELYTAKNPESARSAGLSGYHATEVPRWATGGAQDAAETLSAMRNTLPKKGFHIALEEGTANGAQGAAYETCRTACWPDYADWWKKWEPRWPLTRVEYLPDLQFVFIFAAWFEDARHVPNPERHFTPEENKQIEESLDAEAWYLGERELIERYGQEGPRGLRLGDEVDATVWEQLAWRRGIIKTVCTKRGLDEFKQEYPSDPQEAFRSTGSPALCTEGVLALEKMARAASVEWGTLSLVQPPAGRYGVTKSVWQALAEQHAAEAVFQRWEAPIVGARYLVTCDPMSGAEAITGTGEKDRHSIFVIRDKFIDSTGKLWLARVVARIKPPCQWESKPLAQQIYRLSLYYGSCIIVVEANMGIDVIKELVELNANLYQREEFDHVSQRTTKKLGWWNDAGDRRIAISELQSFVREQKLVCEDPHLVGELSTLIINSKGKAVAGGSNHDDDALALAIGLVCLPWATAYTEAVVQAPGAIDERRWKSA